MHFLPSKKIIALGVVVGGTVTAFLVFRFSSTPSVPLALAPTVRSVSSPTLPETDTDRDGLPDWEEALWKSNPVLDDSDNDGTPDGEEVRKNRNPAIAGPNDLITAQTSAPANNIAVQAPPTRTTEVSRKLLMSLLAFSQNGDIDQTGINTLAGSLTNTLKQNAAVAYNANDINVSANTDRASVQRYANVVVKTLQDYAAAIPDTITLTEHIPSSDTQSGLATLEGGYQNTLSTLEKTPVPRDAVPLHIAFLNAFREITLDVGMIGSIYKDPLAGIGGLVALERHGENLDKAADDLNRYFRHWNISFE